MNWLVCALWGEQGRASLEKAEFPIFKDPPKGKALESRIEFLPREAKQVIEILQPHRTGDKAVFQRLWMLHKLAIMDRHRGIIVRGVMGSFDIPTDPKGRSRTANRLDENTIEVVMPIQDDDFYPTPIFDIVFRAEDVPINITVDTLWDIYHLVADSIFPMLTAHISN